MSLRGYQCFMHGLEQILAPQQAPFCCMFRVSVWNKVFVPEGLRMNYEHFCMSCGVAVNYSMCVCTRTTHTHAPKQSAK